MKLILVRHGTAIEREEAVKMKIDDSQRPLIEKGRERTRRLAKFLKETCGDIEVLVTSPLLRAVQTAEILNGVIRSTKVCEASELVPEAPPQAFARWIQNAVPQGTSLMVVGHEPQLSVFASWCLAGQSMGFIDLKKSGAICLEVETFDHIGPGGAELKWVVSPRVYER